MATTMNPDRPRQASGLVGQSGQLQQPDAADVVHARAEEHDHCPDRVGPAIEDVAGERNQRRSGPKREAVIEPQDQREEIKQEDVTGKDHVPRATMITFDLDLARSDFAGL